jgi:hypothetical protein
MASDQTNSNGSMIGDVEGKEEERLSFQNMEGESKDEHVSLQQPAAEEKTDYSSNQFRDVAIGTVSHHDHNPVSLNGRLPQNTFTSSQAAPVISPQLQVAPMHPTNQHLLMVPNGVPFHSPIVPNPYVVALQNAIQNLAMASAVGTHQQSLQQGNIHPSVITPSMHQAASTFLASVMIPGAASATIPNLQGLQTASSQMMGNDGRLQIPQQRDVTTATATFAGQQASVQPSSTMTLPSAVITPSDEDLTNRSAVPLYLDYDEQALSEYQCLLRKQIELFETRPDDIQGNAQGRNTPIYVGQVGIRCRHCSVLPKAVRPMGTVYYSRTLSGVYQVAQNMAKVHYFGNKCNQMPASTKEQLVVLQRTNKRASGGKEYWVDGLKVHGVYEDGKALRFRPLETGSRGF